MDRGARIVGREKSHVPRSPRIILCSVGCHAGGPRGVGPRGVDRVRGRTDELRIPTCWSGWCHRGAGRGRRVQPNEPDDGLWAQGGHSGGRVAFGRSESRDLAGRGGSHIGANPQAGRPRSPPRDQSDRARRATRSTGACTHPSDPARDSADASAVCARARSAADRCADAGPNGEAAGRVQVGG